MAIELDPKNAIAYTARCQTYIKSLKEAQPAIRDCSKAIELNPSSESAYIARGDAFFIQHLPDEAISDYSMAILLEPKSAETFRLRGEAYYEKGNYQKSVADLETATELKSGNGLAYFSLGQVYFDMGDVSKAIASLSKAIEIDNLNADAYFSRGRAYFALGNFENAVADFREKSVGSPSDPYSRIWLELAERRGQKAGHMSEAVLRVDMRAWPAPIIRMYLGSENPDKVFASAKEAGETVSQKQTCEADFYVGEFVLLQGNKVEAARLFHLAEADCPRHLFEWSSAKAELATLGG